MKCRNSISYLALGILAAVVFCLSYYIEWYGDCHIYRFSFATGKSIESIAEIVHSQWHHYFIMNGRIWAHVLCQAFEALWGQSAFAACNALMYVVFALLLAKICGYRCEDWQGLTLCIISILFFCDTSYNPNCQIGYVWTSTATLAFILLYFHSDGNQSTLRIMALLVLSLLAGNGNEAISIGTGAALAVDFFRHRRKLTPVQMVMAAGFAVGALLLCLAPGIMKRAASVDTIDPVWSAYFFLIHTRMFYVMTITLGVLKLRHKLNLRDFAARNMFFIVALTALIVFNFTIGIGRCSRQLFGVELFSCILTLRALKDVAVTKWIVGLAAVAVAGIYILKFEYLRLSNADLRILRREVAEMADDMTVYIDFHRYPGFVHPTEMENYHNIYNFVAGAIYDDMHDAGNIYRFWKSNGPNPPYFTADGKQLLKILPTAMKNVERRCDKNFAIRCTDGAFLIVQDRKTPKRFFIERVYNIFGLKLPKRPYEVEFAADSYLNMDGMNIVYGFFDAPFVENREIRITE